MDGWARLLVVPWLCVGLLGGGHPARAAEPVASPAVVHFSFDQADIRLLAKVVGDYTGRRLVVDDTVKGRVTVITPGPIPREEVYPVFLSILESSGYSVVQKQGVGFVVPLAERAVPAAPVAEGRLAPGAGLVTRVIRLENVSALELKKMLEPMVRGGKNGAVAAFVPSNHLILTDTSDNLLRLERIIAELDRPGTARVVEVVRLEHASAEEVAAQLLAAVKGMATAGSRVSQQFQQIAEGAAALPADLLVVPAPQANSVILVGGPMQMNEVRRVIAMMDVPSPSGYGRLSAIFLQYLTAEDAAKSLNALLAKTTAKDQRQRIAIEPSAANNALIVDAAPQDLQYVRDLIASLDRQPEQVLVEVLIAEIELKKEFDFGVEWSRMADFSKEDTTVAVGYSRPGENSTIMDMVTKNVFPQGMAVGVAKGTYTDSEGNLRPQIPFMVKALAGNRDAKILSSVPLWAQNNTEASVSVVENIPILKSTIEGGSGSSRDVIQNIERLDVGIKLKLTPHVNPERQVSLKLNPSIEAIIDQGSSELQYTPTIAKREVSTTVTVADKTTVVISGLIREDIVKTTYKIPILGDIPLLGLLFRNQSNSKRRTNLMVFVTPHIVTDADEALRLRRGLESRTFADASATNFTMQAPAARKSRK